MSRQTVAVLFGGQSSEHEVSCMSAVNIIKCIDAKRYDILIIGITKEGHWVYCPDVERISDGTWAEADTAAIFSPDATKKAVYLLKEGVLEDRKIDVVFPVLHGLYGEDGTVQGLFELAQIPYVGCGVLASAVSMDKVYTKIIVDTLNIKQAKYVVVHAGEVVNQEAVAKRVEAALSYPVFVKPSCAGSSKGVSKAGSREELFAALAEAAKHDRKILVEETLIGREIECAVLGGKEVQASGVGEVLAAAEFYDYEAKYFNAESKTDVEPNLGDGVRQEVRDAAVSIFKAVDGHGLSRVDFFLTKDGVVFNEINTLPGFTAISMYPMLWEHQGISKEELIQQLIDIAFTRKGDELHG